jgi:hypothetical protein
MDFMFAHVRTNHQEKYQESKGKSVVVCRQEARGRGYAEILPFKMGGWTCSVQPFCRRASLYPGPLTVEHYVVIEDPGWKK